MVVEIERKGHKLKILTDPPLSKNDDPESLVSTDWSEYWSGGEDL